MWEAVRAAEPTNKTNKAQLHTLTAWSEQNSFLIYTETPK